jgi:hypothetical protein
LAPLGGPQERRATATGGVHDGAHIVHSSFEAWQIAIVHPIAQTGTAFVELNQAGEGAEPLEQMVIAGVFPMDVQIG